jgi:hypothetical protein
VVLVCEERVACWREEDRVATNCEQRPSQKHRTSGGTLN